MSLFKNTTAEDHARMAWEKKQALKYRAQGTDGFIWLVLAGVFIIWCCRSEVIEVHKWNVAAVGNVPYHAQESDPVCHGDGFPTCFLGWRL